LVLKFVQNIADHVLVFENQVSEIYALHNDINENMSSRIFYTFRPIWNKGAEYDNKTERCFLSFVKIVALGAILHL